jgi:hypothetical protein
MNHTAAAGRHPLKGGPAIAAIAAVGPFAAGVITGIVGLVVVAIGREERNLTLTSGQPTT